MEHIGIKCDCGCGGEAVYLCVGFDYDPRKPDGCGQPYKSPMCINAALYCEESAAEFSLPFVKQTLT